MWSQLQVLGPVQNSPVDSNPSCRQLSCLPIALSEADRGSFTGNPVLKMSKLKLARSIKVIGLLGAGLSTSKRAPSSSPSPREGGQGLSLEGNEDYENEIT